MISHPAPLDAGADRLRLDVVCVSTGTLVEHALNHGASASPGFALLCTNAPMLLVGAGTGVLRQTLHHLGQLPPAVFLPSAAAHHTADLQAMIQYEASYGRKLCVYAASDVLDAAIAAIDEDIVADVRTYVEFLQIELGAPTSFHPNFYLITQRCDTKTPRYNLCVLDQYQKALLVSVEGPLTYQSVFQQAPCAIVRHHRGFIAERLYADLSHAKLLVIGYPADARIASPATALRAGDAFVAPVAKGAPALTVPAETLRSATTAAATAHDPSVASGRWADPRDDSLFVTNRGEERMNLPIERGPRPVSPAARHAAGWSADYGYEPADGAPLLATASRPGARSPAGYASRHYRNGALDGGIGSSGGGYGVYPHPGSAAHNQQHHHARNAPQPPRKVYVFNNEVKEAEPVIVMVSDHTVLQALKVKIGTMLNIRPMGHLYTVDGGLVRDAAQLVHCQEVVATKHAGAPFDLTRLPHGMQFVRPAAPM